MKPREEAHYNRYMASRRKRLIIMLAASIAFTVICWGYMYPRNADYSWFAMAIMLPVMVKYPLTARAAKKYARTKAKK